jgi:hypothetical protein
MASLNPREQLTEALLKNQDRLAGGLENDEATRLLRAHMGEISGNPEGSDPSVYLNESDAAVVAEFVDIASSLGWPASEPIEMLKHNIPGKAAWTNPRYAAKNNVVRGIFFHRVSPQLRGYRFGKLRTPLGQPVAIAEDGNLYSLRGTELTASDGVGWGALPDRPYLDDAIERGSVITYYGSTLLSKVLAGKIPR